MAAMKTPKPTTPMSPEGSKVLAAAGAGAAAGAAAKVRTEAEWKAAKASFERNYASESAETRSATTSHAP